MNRKLGDFIYVPIIALFCYIFLFMTLAAARKDRIINSFLLNLVALIFWTGGSFLMRLQVWPSVKFWFDISILGLLLLGFALFNFAFQFVGCKNKLIQIFWFVVTVVINVINITTGVFLQSPELVTAPNEETAFVYHTTWPVVFFFIFCTAIIAHMFLLLFRYFKDHEVARRQFVPVMVGIGFMFLGHIAFIIPVFQGIPTDIIAGVPFALCMFYALYRRRLFRLTLLASRGSCYALSAGLSVIVFINLLGPMASFIQKQLPMLGHYDTLIIALSFTIFTCLVYFCMKKFIDSVFVKEEILQAENLKAFSPGRLPQPADRGNSDGTHRYYPKNHRRGPCLRQRSLPGPAVLPDRAQHQPPRPPVVRSRARQSRRPLAPGTRRMPPHERIPTDDRL